MYLRLVNTNRLDSEPARAELQQLQLFRLHLGSLIDLRRSFIKNNSHFQPRRLLCDKPTISFLHRLRVVRVLSSH
jgi:hypothetical protein